MKVKICGLTTTEDALAAIDAGADLLGFNFYPASPRSITPEVCSRIVSAVRSKIVLVTLIGVFVNVPANEVKSVLAFCGLDLAQLHGDELPEDLKALDEKAYKALRPRDYEDLIGSIRRYPCHSENPAFLIDAYQPGLYGGTGQVGDWSMAKMIAHRLPILLAGGLTPGNVAEAIKQVHPWGVDAASGVETSPGKKDLVKMAAFIRQAKGGFKNA